MTAALTFAVVAPTLYAAHKSGDYWVQTNHQALTKGNPLLGFRAQLACLRHVATYTATTALFTGVVWFVFNRVAETPDDRLGITWYGFVLGQMVSAVTHYIADRRWPIEILAMLLDPIAGKHDFFELGRPRPGHDDNPTLGTGAAALDQSWHWLWLWVAAILTAVVR